MPVIDRRLSGKNKSIGNRERFLRRHRTQIQEAVKRAIGNRGIRDIDKEENVHIPKKDIHEPTFHHGQGGKREIVHPGNQEYEKGDRIGRSSGGGKGGNGSEASDSGEGDDDFVFTLTKEEFMDIFFDDLALPDLIRTQLADVTEWKSQRAGFSSEGTPNNLALVRSKRHEIGRRIGSGIPAKIADCLEQLELLEWLWDHSSEHDSVEPEIRARSLVEYERLTAELEEQLEALRVRRDGIRLDPLDLRYRARVRVPVPTAKAVMFCLMDVSGSMDEIRKDLAKRFFILLYLFLTRHYEKIDIVFLRHHTQAQEVNEEEFFRSTETGGTVVSSVLLLMEEIIRARYPINEWNIYGAQASDGDNWHHDSGRCRELLEENILPQCRYFAYVQVHDMEQNLWDEYATIEARNFAMRKVAQASQIYPVFHDLFKKETTA